MKRIEIRTLVKWLAFSIPFLFISCSEDEDTYGNWVEKSDFEGIPRSATVAFSLNGKGYVGTGYDGSDYYKDFWVYDAEKDYWKQVADLPGVERAYAVAFTVGSFGYVGTGYDGDNKLKDFYRYNDQTNTWEPVADFGGSSRYAAIALSLGNKGYVGTGNDDNDKKDFWEYDPETNVWTQKVSVGGSKRRNAVAFTINGKGYVGTGINNGIYETDFWEYDPQSDIWSEKNSLDEDDNYSIVRSKAVAFSINDKGYIGTGDISGSLNTFWEYDPELDEWEKITDFEGVSRYDAVSFVIGNQPYITTGRNGSYWFDDIWTFNPFEEYDSED